MGMAGKVVKKAGGAAASAAKRAVAGVPVCQLCRRRPGEWFRQGRYVCAECKKATD